MSNVGHSVSKESKFLYRDSSEFKQVESDWIEELPSDWSLIKLARCLDSLESGSREKYDGEDGVLSIGGEHIDDRGNLKLEDVRYISEEFYSDMNGGKISGEDVLLVKDGATIGKTAFVDTIPSSKAAVNSHVYILRGKKLCFNKYLYYLISSNLVQDQITVSITGSAQAGLSRKFTKFVDLPLPPKPEQKDIVNFLDEEISKINDLIDYKEKMIDLIDEKRTALVSNAVTQGLNTEEKMSDTGIPGVGAIPDRWDLVPLKHSSRKITVGIVQKPSQYYVDDGVPALRSLNVESNEIVEDDMVYISEEANEDLKGSQIYAGDLVSVRSGDPGTTAVVPEELDGVNCIDLVIIREPEGYIPEFLSFLMNSEASTSQIEAGTEGAAQQHFNVEEVKELVFPKPSIEEQREILDWLSPRLEELDELEEKIREGIERLKEYRTALITNAVTGQIDVRGEV